MAKRNGAAKKQKSMEETLWDSANKLRGSGDSVMGSSLAAQLRPLRAIARTKRKSEEGVLFFPSNSTGLEIHNHSVVKESLTAQMESSRQVNRVEIEAVGCFEEIVYA